MKPRSFILYVLERYSRIISKKFHRFLTHEVMPLLPETGYVNMTRESVNQILETMYRVKESRECTPWGVSVICRIICSNIVTGISLKDVLAEFYSLIKEAPPGYKTFVMNAWLAVDKGKRIHEEYIVSVLAALNHAKRRGDFSDEALEKLIQRFSIIR